MTSQRLEGGRSGAGEGTFRLLGFALHAETLERLALRETPGFLWLGPQDLDPGTSWTMGDEISAPLRGQAFRHRKGSLYRVFGVGRHVTTGEIFVVYAGVNGGLWVRNRQAFLDGRFTRAPEFDAALRLRPLAWEAPRAFEPAGLEHHALGILGRSYTVRSWDGGRTWTVLQGTKVLRIYKKRNLAGVMALAQRDYEAWAEPILAAVELSPQTEEPQAAPPAPTREVEPA